MSFLAQLRQKQPDSHRGLRLCYALEVGENNGALELYLALSELQQGQLRDAGKPYRILRQHLQNLPPFMSAADLSPLSQLVEANTGWLLQEDGYIPLETSDELISTMVSTERCFIKMAQGHWQRLSLGEPVDAELTWLPTHAGVLELIWVMDRKLKVLWVDAERCYPLAYDASRGLLSRVKHKLSTAALDSVKRAPRVLPAVTVQGFLQQHQETWTALELPLPEQIEQQEFSAELTPVLRFVSRSKGETAGEIEDGVSLMFRVTGEPYCTCIPFGANSAVLDYWDGTAINRLARDEQLEAELYAKLLPYMDELESASSKGSWFTAKVEIWKKLLTEVRPKLEQQGVQFWIDSGFRHHYVVADQWQLEIGEADDQFLQLSLMLDLDGDRINLFDLLRQLQAFNRDQSGKETTLTLPDGRLLLLPAKRASGIMDELGDLLAKQGGVLQLPRSQVSRLEGLNQQLPESTQWRGAVEHLELSSSLHETPALLDKILEGVEAELRPYQWLGVCWLQHLKRHRVNGLLADDMGLGKTLQTLAHLSLERQHGELQNPALIVAPTSLLHNWLAEMKRFTPQLRVRIVHGAKRQQHWKQLKGYDVLITSYQLVVNDLARWQEQKLSWVILDEAHQIKNPRTQVSQALRHLESGHRLCLSGTPVQNHLGELWSLLDFLMPGCLGGYSDFKQYFQKPIEQEANEARMAQLQKRIAPFMLRRTKDQVAQDLPAKTEIYQHISFADDQQALYDEQKTTGQTELQKQLADTEHGGQRQILLLTALLKLRQVCCDPELLGVSNISSAKREHCIDMVEELVEEGRAILLFSQFTSMLDLLAEELEKLDIPYLKLTGQSRNRPELVEAFQRGDAPVFLISLKAGGVGLNLTRADTVIHYDPWWNIAAEQQATDRAHRIGQDKPVFVYKLIAENTIEEKIAQLQQHKAQISNHINYQAQISGEQFALKLEDLMALWQQETKLS